MVPILHHSRAWIDPLHCPDSGAPEKLTSYLRKIRNKYLRLKQERRRPVERLCCDFENGAQKLPEMPLNWNAIP